MKNSFLLVGLLAAVVVISGCTGPVYVCGDNVCSSGESCSSCPRDCGSCNTVTGFAGFEVADWAMGSHGKYAIYPINDMGAAIKITSMDASINGQTNSISEPVTLEPNTGETFIIDGFYGFKPGTKYTAFVTITYDNLNSGLTGFTSTGTTTGSVS